MRRPPPTAPRPRSPLRPRRWHVARRRRCVSSKCCIPWGRYEDRQQDLSEMLLSPTLASLGALPAMSFPASARRRVLLNLADASETHAGLKQADDVVLHFITLHRIA